MSNDEKYLLNFGGREIDSRDFVRRAQNKVVDWMDYQNLKGDERKDFLDTFNTAIQNIVNRTWTISDYGRIIGLEYNKGQQYTKDGKRLEPGEKSWFKGKVNFDAANSVETYLNGIAGVSNKISSNSAGKKSWSKSSAGVSILSAIYGDEDNIPKDEEIGSQQLTNWAEEVNDKYINGKRSTEGRVKFIKDVLSNYLNDVQNGVYDISDVDKQSEVNKITKILADGKITPFELGTLRLQGLLFEGEKFLSNKQITEATEKSKQQEQQDAVKEFISGLTDVNPYEPSDPRYAEAQKQHDAALENQKKEEEENEFNRYNPEWSSYTITKENIPLNPKLTNIAMSFNKDQMWKAYDIVSTKVWYNGTDLNKILDSYSNVNKNNLYKLSCQHFAKYLNDNYKKPEYRINKNMYVIPESIDWAHDKILMIKCDESGNAIKIVKSSLSSKWMSPLKTKNSTLYNRLHDSYNSEKAFLKQGGIIKLQEGGTPEQQSLRYWFDPEEVSVFKDNDDLQKFYRNQFEWFWNHKRARGYYSNPSWNTYLNRAMFSAKGLEEFEKYLETLTGEDEQRGKALARILKESYAPNENSSYDNLKGYNTTNTQLVLTENYKKYLRDHIKLPDGITWDQVFGPTSSDPVLRKLQEEYNNAVGIEHLLHGLINSPNPEEPEPDPNKPKDGEGDGEDGNGNGNEVPGGGGDIGHITPFRKYPGVNYTDNTITLLEDLRNNNINLANWRTLDILRLLSPVLRSPTMEHYKQYTDKPLEDQASKNSADLRQRANVTAAGTSDQGQATAANITYSKEDVDQQNQIAIKQADDTRASIDKENEVAQKNHLYRHKVAEENNQALIAKKNMTIQGLAEVNSKNSEINANRLRAIEEGITTRANYEWDRDKAYAINNDKAVIRARKELEDAMREKATNPKVWSDNKAENESRLKALKYAYQSAVNDATNTYEAWYIRPSGVPYAQWGSRYTGVVQHPFYFNKQGGKFQYGGKMWMAEQEKTKRAYEKMFYDILRRHSNHMLQTSRDAYKYYRKLMMQDHK